MLGRPLQVGRTVGGGKSFPAGGVTGRWRSRWGRASPVGGATLRAASQGGGRGGEEDALSGEEDLGGALQAGMSVAGGSYIPAGVVAGRWRLRRARAGARLCFPFLALSSSHAQLLSRAGSRNFLRFHAATPESLDSSLPRAPRRR
jgi:hypothetical protein